MKQLTLAGVLNNCKWALAKHNVHYQRISSHISKIISGPREFEGKRIKFQSIYTNTFRLSKPGNINDLNLDLVRFGIKFVSKVTKSRPGVYQTESYEVHRIPVVENGTCVYEHIENAVVKICYKDWKIHNEDGPAIIIDAGGVQETHWFLQGAKYHDIHDFAKSAGWSTSKLASQLLNYGSDLTEQIQNKC